MKEEGVKYLKDRSTVGIGEGCKDVLEHFSETDTVSIPAMLGANQVSRTRQRPMLG